jgi:hypothetical protein
MEYILVDDLSNMNNLLHLSLKHVCTDNKLERYQQCKCLYSCEVEKTACNLTLQNRRDERKFHQNLPELHEVASSPSMTITQSLNCNCLFSFDDFLTVEVTPPI